MSSVITWFFLVMAALVSAAIPIYLWWQKKTASGGSSGNPVSAKNKASDLKSLWEIQEIKNGVIILSGGCRYRMILRLAAADFYLMGKNEQTLVEDSLAAALLGLTFPVQFLTVSEVVDTRRAVRKVKENLHRLAPAIAECALNYAAYLENLSRGKTAATTAAYMVIPYDTVQGFDHALNELEARAMSLAGALQGARIKTEILTTPAVVDLLHHLLNRSRAWRPSDADAAGAMELYHVAERSAVDDILEKAV